MNDNTIKVLTKNSVRCLVCNTILESKHRHDYVKCHCPNETTCDGGLEYQRTLAVDLSLIENLCEYRTLTQEDYDNLIKQTKAKQLAKNEQGVKDGLLVKIGNDYYSKEIITLLYDNKQDFQQEEEKMFVLFEYLMNWFILVLSKFSNKPP